jgi:hypothetical protein
MSGILTKKAGNLVNFTGDALVIFQLLKFSKIKKCKYVLSEKNQFLNFSQKARREMETSSALLQLKKKF